MPESKKLIIFGTGTLAELALYYFTNDSRYQVVAFCADQQFVHSGNFNGLPLVAFEEIAQLYSPEHHEMFIAVGYKNNNQIKKSKFDQAKALGYKLASYISSKSAYWPDCTTIGENVMVMENNTLQPFCIIGNNVLIWAGTMIAHHTKIEDHVTITSHTVIGGNCTIGEMTFIGQNATLRDGITIVPNTIIATGANVVKSIGESGVYVGNPAHYKMSILDAKL